MPEFESTVDVEVYEIIDACSYKEKIELVSKVVEECTSNPSMEKELRRSLTEHFPTIKLGTDDSPTFDHEVFIKSLEALLSSYYSLPNETIETINSLASRFK